MKITTDYMFGEWTAIDADTYDVGWDAERGYYSQSLVGHGKTEREAVADLMAKMEEGQ
jgi:hypothetical protein